MHERKDGAYHGRSFYITWGGLCSRTSLRQVFVALWHTRTPPACAMRCSLWKTVLRADAERGGEASNKARREPLFVRKQPTGRNWLRTRRS